MSGAVAAVAAIGGPVFGIGSSVSDTFVANCSVTKQYSSNGQIINTTTSTGGVHSEDWCIPTAYAPGGRTIRAHLVSGTAPTGDTLDADLALSSSRSWGLSQSSTGSKTCTLTITIKDSLGNTLATGNVVLTATVP